MATNENKKMPIKSDLWLNMKRNVGGKIYGMCNTCMCWLLGYLAHFCERNVNGVQKLEVDTDEVCTGKIIMVYNAVAQLRLIMLINTFLAPVVMMSINTKPI